jgi:tetratricopeptide (TPR) repeat protein
MKKTALVLMLVLAGVVLVYSGALKDPQSLNGYRPQRPMRQDPALETARSLIKAGDLASAEQELLKENGGSVYDEERFQLLSFIYVKSGDIKGAFRYAKPLAEKSTDPKVLVDLGSLFAMEGYDQMGLACYSKALNVDASYIPGYVELGKLYGNQEKFIQAISVWQDGLRLAPENQELKDLILQANALWQQKGIDSGM